jgi:hypothetical protein
MPAFGPDSPVGVRGRKCRFFVLKVTPNKLAKIWNGIKIKV